MIEKEPGTNWQDLQDRVAAILNECGFYTETPRTIGTAHGNVEIDVWAIDPTTTPPALYLCECKRWKSNVPQNEVHAFRTVVADAGAHFGLFISATGFQKGALETVKYTNVRLVSWPEFQAMFVERWARQFWVPTFRTGADRLAACVDPSISDAGVADAHNDRPLKAEEAVGLMALSMWSLGGNPQLVDAIWKLRDRYRQFLPGDIAQAKYLRELLDSLLTFARDWMKQTGRT